MLLLLSRFSRSDSVRPHRWQPTRLPRPWDPPGKNTGVGCHFLLQCMQVKSESEVSQSCPALSNPTDYSLPGCSVHGISQARILEWVTISFSWGSDQTQVSCIAGRRFTNWATREYFCAYQVFFFFFWKWFCEDKFWECALFRQNVWAFQWLCMHCSGF